METLNEQYFEDLVQKELHKKGFRLIAITRDYLNNRINEIMEFVNGILKEHEKIYPCWDPKPKEWFTNPLDRKFKYSYLIEDEKHQIAFFNFTSVYNVLLHNHCSFTGKDYRGLGLAKLHMMKIALEGLKEGFSKYEGYWDKHNNGSLILHLKMGFKIEDMRKKEQLYLLGDLEEIMERTHQLYSRNS